MIGSLLIQGGRVIDPSSGRDEQLDVRVVGGLVEALSAKLEPRAGEIVIDARELWVTPGFIDIHTHLRDLGQKDKEDFETGTKAAAAGGYTTVVCMANTEPPIDNPTTLSLVLSRIERKAQISVLPVACVTKQMEGKELTNMVELAEVGAVAFSDDGITIGNMSVLRRALEYARLADRPIISHAEDSDLAFQGVIDEGLKSSELGLSGIPAAAETVAVAREIEVVRNTNAPYHFAHLSCAGSIELVRRAKADGLPVTADVTPHHLILTVDDIPGYDTNYKTKPPLRKYADLDALLAGLKDGTIDAIATDHAPHTRLEKATTMDDAAAGIIGLETAFALTAERLVAQGLLTRLEFISLITTRPARILGIERPSLAQGCTANITLSNPAAKWTYDALNGQSRSHNSPFSGRQLLGRVVLTLFQGQRVFGLDEELARRLKQQ